MTDKATTSILLDTRRKKKDGTYPVKIRVTFQRKQVYYSSPYDLTIDEFSKIMGERPREKYKDIKLTIQAIEKKAADIIKGLPSFDWQVFEKKFTTNRTKTNKINHAFDDYINILREQNRIGTAVSYGCAKNSLNKFKSNIKFTDITSEFLYKYEQWMIDAGNSVTTIGIYLRSLRTLINKAIDDGELSKDQYPFGKRKYEIPASKNIKKALTLDEISKIYHYSPVSKGNAEMAKNYWLFMYFCNGINVKDLCLLRYDNIHGDVLSFERAKTARTKRTTEQIRLILQDDAKAIIEIWGNKDRSGFIFPILTREETASRQRQLIQQLTRVINDHMKNIGTVLEINKPLTTYAARHSFATVLKRSGASTEFISEALGHSNLKTTQSYLDGFEDETLKEVTKALVAFKK